MDESGAMKTWVLSLAAGLARLLPIPFKRQLYRWKPLADSIRRLLNRAAPPGLTEVRIAAGGLEGMRLKLDLHCEKEYWLGTYETELQAAIHRFVQPGMVAYDVGANIGYISLLLARRVGAQGQVYAFEALPQNLERLRAHVAMNGLEAHIRIIPLAVVDRSGKVHFLIGPSHGTGKVKGSAGREEFAYRGTLEIEGISLDSFVYEQGHPPPQVMKIDIEGGEVLAMAGMSRVLREHPPLIFLELHGEEAARVAWSALKKNDYHLCHMHPPCQEVPSPEALDWKAYLIAFPPNWELSKETRLLRWRGGGG